VKSMTGFGYQEWRDTQVTLSVEIKGYNNRFLEVAVNLPPLLSPLESRVREFIAGQCERGKVEVTIRFKELASDVNVTVDEKAAQAYYGAIKTLATALNIDEKPHLSLILGMEGVLQIDKVRDTERYWGLIKPTLEKTAELFNSERVREGESTRNDILYHLGEIEKAQDTVSAYVPVLENSIKENLRNRFKELLGDGVDENRILAETAVLLMKYTISEELSRLRAHLQEFRAEEMRNPAPGKKLDFLCQEINREINTIGSKSPVLEVSQAVVAMKDSLENIREQLRNVE